MSVFLNTKASCSTPVRSALPWNLGLFSAWHGVNGGRKRRTVTVVHPSKRSGFNMYVLVF